MIPRPKNTDTMDDVLKMQSEYLKQRAEEDFKPAAQAICQEPKPKQSVFAKRRQMKQAESDKKQKVNSVLGEIVERNINDSNSSDSLIDEAAGPSSEELGFPKSSPIDIRAFDGKSDKSVFSQLMQSKIKQSAEVISMDDPMMEKEPNDDLEVSPKVKEENDMILSGMTQEEILAEQAKLNARLDPKLIEFVKKRAKERENIPKVQKVRVTTSTKRQPPNDLPALDFLNREDSKSWLNFHVLEPEKLEWMKDIEERKCVKPGETYEARFDLKGLLLPYIDNQKLKDSPEKEKDDRELYFHGEEPHRPGYTLQEFFRLARSSNMQQRILALKGISGLIRIYNQGYYDTIIDLPMSKIFFVLRFALDDNVHASLEVSSTALSYLFYNESDEMLLDTIYESRRGLIQPILKNKEASFAGLANDEVDFDLEASLKNMNLNDGKKLFESKLTDFVDDSEQSTETKNDFHLAEVNLVECLLRTNIIERISYILTVTHPSEVTVIACIKILIRLARSSKETAKIILNKKNLIEQIITDFKFPVHGHDESHCLSMKLLRVIASLDKSFCTQLKHLKVAEMAKTVITKTQELTARDLKLQIECFRFLRLYFKMSVDETLFGEIIPPMRFLLEWHYQKLDFEVEENSLPRQHACSLLYLLGCGNLVVTFHMFSETIKLCLSKWFSMATRLGAAEFTQKLLLATLLDIGRPFVERSTGYFFSFIDKHLLPFLQSGYYQQITYSLIKVSPLIKGGFDRCNVHKPLLNLGSVFRQRKKASPTTVLGKVYSVFFMDALLVFTEAFNSMSDVKNPDYKRKLCDAFLVEDVEKYFEEFAEHFDPSLSINWFLKTEVGFLFNLLNSKFLQFNQSLLKVAFNLLNCLTQEATPLIFYVLQKFVFNARYYFAKDELKAEFDVWKFIYNGIVMSKLPLERDTSVSFAAENWNQALLNVSWPYSPLLILLYKAEVDADRKKVVETNLTEEQIINTTLKFTLVLEKNHVHLISQKQKLMYLMLVYFGEKLNFLDHSVKEIIREKLKSMKRHQFPKRFNIKLNKEKSFESLYTMLLETFQSNSYADDLFSVFVMIPLAQKYDVKWRKLVWSEYVTTMKFITCKEEALLEDISEYLYPIETDLSLLKCYSNALATNFLREDSIPWKIAQHHTTHAKRSES